MMSDEYAAHAHDEALRARLEPFGSTRVRQGFYRIGNRVYDFTATDPAQLGVAIAKNLAPYTLEER